MKIWGMGYERKFGYHQTSVELGITEALELYNGGLYKLLQEEFRKIEREEAENAERRKELTLMKKMLVDSGIKKPPTE